MALSTAANNQYQQSSTSSSSFFHFLSGAALLTGAAAGTVLATSSTPSECAHAANTTPAMTHQHQQHLNAAMGQLRTQFSCPLAVLNNLAKQMNTEMKKGLIATEGAEIKMLPSFVSQLPTGTETGEFLALDLGGSNFRVVTFRLAHDQNGVQQIELVEARKVTIPAALMTSSSNASDLFGFIADQVGQAPGAKDTTTPQLNLGFTFSFPVEQQSIDSGILLHWTKGFATKGCVGEEIVQLLQQELVARGISVNVSALVNDTVGTLVANIVEDKDTHVGVILGTGCNACYTEKMANIVKMPNASGDVEQEMVSGPGCRRCTHIVVVVVVVVVGGVGGGGGGWQLVAVHLPSVFVYLSYLFFLRCSQIINMEWGGFNSHKVPGASTRFDHAIDREEDPTSQRFEKQISGRYLGEITRKVCVDLMDSGLLFAHADEKTKEAANHVFRHKHHFTTPMMSAIEGSEPNYVHSLGSDHSKFANYFIHSSVENQHKIRTGWVLKSAMDAVINLNGADGPEAFSTQTAMAQDFVNMWSNASEHDRHTITQVCHLVSTRAARLAAAAVVAVVRKTKRTKCTVAVDGSVFEKYPHFQTDMEHAIDEMCGASYQLKLVHAEDGSGKGAALIASVL